MKPYRPKGNYQDPKSPNRRQPSSNWRKKYKCKKLKGDHDFELVKPSTNWHFKEEHPELTVDEYYEMEDRKYDECKTEQEVQKRQGLSVRRWCGFGKTRHYRCKACGKHDMKWDRN